MKLLLLGIILGAIGFGLLRWLCAPSAVLVVRWIEPADEVQTDPRPESLLAMA
jgi:hypothetical protein